MDNNQSRRKFMVRISQMTGLSVLLGTPFLKSALAQEKRRSGGKADGAKDGAAAKPLDFPIVEPGKDVALAMAYFHNHKDAEKNASTDKKTDKGLAWDQRFCKNCNFFKGVGKKGSDEVGTCTIFPNKLVKSEGICNSWAKKA